MITTTNVHAYIASVWSIILNPRHSLLQMAFTWSIVGAILCVTITTPVGSDYWFMCFIKPGGQKQRPYISYTCTCVLFWSKKQSCILYILWFFYYILSKIFYGADKHYPGKHKPNSNTLWDITHWRKPFMDIISYSKFSWQYL